MRLREVLPSRQALLDELCAGLEAGGFQLQVRVPRGPLHGKLDGRGPARGAAVGVAARSRTSRWPVASWEAGCAAAWAHPTATPSVPWGRQDGPVRRLRGAASDGTHTPCALPTARPACPAALPQEATLGEAEEALAANKLCGTRLLDAQQLAAAEQAQQRAEASAVAAGAAA